MPSVPSPEDCRRLLAALGTPPAVIAHAETVERVATAIASALSARGAPIDGPLVTAGALLHDIGRSRTHGLDHAVVGAQLLRDRGYPEPLVLIVERHTGGGIDPEEARLLSLPVRDYTPRSLEEKIVCQADNLVDGPRRQKVQEELVHLQARGLSRVAVKIAALHRELSAMAGRDLDDLA